MPQFLVDLPLAGRRFSFECEAWADGGKQRKREASSYIAPREKI
jgi:hypothetical protein